MRIEFGDLKLDEGVAKHIQDIVETSWVSEGPKVKKFEEEWRNI